METKCTWGTTEEIKENWSFLNQLVQKCARQPETAELQADLHAEPAKLQALAEECEYEHVRKQTIVDESQTEVSSTGVRQTSETDVEGLTAHNGATEASFLAVTREDMDTVTTEASPTKDKMGCCAEAAIMKEESVEVVSEDDGVTISEEDSKLELQIAELETLHEEQMKQLQMYTERMSELKEQMQTSTIDCVRDVTERLSCKEGKMNIALPQNHTNVIEKVQEYNLLDQNVAAMSKQQTKPAILSMKLSVKEPTPEGLEIASTWQRRDKCVANRSLDRTNVREKKEIAKELGVKMNTCAQTAIILTNELSSTKQKLFEMRLRKYMKDKESKNARESFLRTYENSLTEPQFGVEQKKNGEVNEVDQNDDLAECIPVNKTTSDYNLLRTCESVLIEHPIEEVDETSGNVKDVNEFNEDAVATRAWQLLDPGVRPSTGSFKCLNHSDENPTQENTKRDMLITLNLALMPINRQENSTLSTNCSPTLSPDDIPPAVQSAGEVAEEEDDEERVVVLSVANTMVTDTLSPGHEDQSLIVVTTTTESAASVGVSALTDPDMSAVTADVLTGLTDTTSMPRLQSETDVAQRTGKRHEDITMLGELSDKARRFLREAITSLPVCPDLDVHPDLLDHPDLIIHPDLASQPVQPEDPNLLLYPELIDHPELPEYSELAVYPDATLCQDLGVCPDRVQICSSTCFDLEQSIDGDLPDVTQLGGHQIEAVESELWSRFRNLVADDSTLLFSDDIESTIYRHSQWSRLNHKCSRCSENVSQHCTEITYQGGIKGKAGNVARDGQEETEDAHCFGPRNSECNNSGRNDNNGLVLSDELMEQLNAMAVYNCPLISLHNPLEQPSALPMLKNKTKEENNRTSTLEPCDADLPSTGVEAGAETRSNVAHPNNITRQKLATVGAEQGSKPSSTPCAVLSTTSVLSDGSANLEYMSAEEGVDDECYVAPRKHTVHHNGNENQVLLLKLGKYMEKELMCDRVTSLTALKDKVHHLSEELTQIQRCLNKHGKGEDCPSSTTRCNSSTVCQHMTLNLTSPCNDQNLGNYISPTSNPPAGSTPSCTIDHHDFALPSTLLQPGYFKAFPVQQHINESPSTFLQQSRPSSALKPDSQPSCDLLQQKYTRPTSALRLGCSPPSSVHSGFTTKSSSVFQQSRPSSAASDCVAQPGFTQISSLQPPQFNVVIIGRVTTDSILVGWEVPYDGYIKSFRIYVDDAPKLAIHSGSRTTAVLHEVNLLSIFTITIQAISLHGLCSAIGRTKYTPYPLKSGN